ncbi:MAG TPA: heme-binding domain-containing protein [Pyrinomonadaceae bacterium]|jgi:hypothetical protein|nr:heme-binding domain-containing protein [Pyrinomonadaceae bacterium]
MKKALKLTAIVLALLFVGLQFVRPARTNPAAVAGQSLEEVSPPPAEVARVLDRSCMDCHSNRTRWPWYSNVSPVSWFVADHVEEGRREMNFSRWGGYTERQREGRLRAVCGTVREGFMPLNSYTLVHRGAALTPDDAKALCDWAASEEARLSSSRER